MKRSLPKISVIIPTHNGWMTLRQSIESLMEQSLPPTEIVVVDNGSSDNTATNIKRYFPKVRLVKLTKNTGVTGGRNTGIEAADKKYDYLLFFDHDMVAGREMLEELVLVSQMNKKYGIITPRIYYWENKNIVWAAGTNINLLTGQVLFRGGKDEGQFEDIEEVQVAPAVMLVNSDAMKALRCFDTRYFTTYEDTDFCFRAKKFGHLTVYAPNATAYHKIPINKSLSNQRLLERAFWIARNRIAFMHSYSNNFYLFLLISPIYLLYFLILSVQEKNLQGLVMYIKGYLSGLAEYLVDQRLLIYIPFSTYWFVRRAIGKGRRDVLDIGCGSGKKMGILSRYKNWSIIGVDVYEPDVAIARSSEIYTKVVIGDLKTIGRLFKNKDFDVIFSSEVVEHFKKTDAIKLIGKMESIGKKVVMTTPNGFVEKYEGCFFEGDNLYQAHLSGWQASDFTTLGYKVYGLGINFLNGKYGYLEYILAYLLNPLSYFYPRYARSLLAVKDVKTS